MTETKNKSVDPEQDLRQRLEALAEDADEDSGPVATFMDRLSEAERRALTDQSCSEWHTAGSVICHEGELGNLLYIIESGQVAVLKEVGEGRPTLLGYRGPGEILGEMRLVSHQPRSATLIAETDTELLCIEADKFSALMDKHLGLSWAVLNVLNDRLHEADQARTAIVQEGEMLTQRLERLTGEAAQLAELARVRQETIELIAHDLRTPLAVLDGCLQMIQNSLSEESRQSVAEILDLAEHGTQRLLALVEELLGAARREVSGAALVWRPVNLAQLLQTVIESAQVTAKETKILLELSLAPDLPRPQGDMFKLERVLTNLVDNALSYTPDGGSIVVAATRCGADVEISVTDTGPGVPPEHRDLIFERFTRVPGVRGRRKGFGLGLYYCKQVIKAHGGHIWVEPGLTGKGSRFVFTLPIQGGAADD